MKAIIKIAYLLQTISCFVISQIQVEAIVDDQRKALRYIEKERRVDLDYQNEVACS